jgi:ABC-type oligopeptide transport system ATPase subunit
VFNVLILIAGGLFLYNGKINFGEYSTFIVSVNLFIAPVQTLVNFTEQWQNGATGFKRFLEIMDVPEEQDLPDAKDLGIAEGDISLRDICFSYTENEKSGVLDHISLTIPKGTKLALVGPSGGGKTTICHLIPRFYPLDENSGSILIDGKDLRKLTMDSVRRNIGIVQQDVFLFSGSIRDNIRYGCLDATDEQITEAAKNAKLHDFVMSLPDGFERKGDIEEMVQNIDYAPTFLELAGVPVPEDIHGESIVPLLKGEKPADWRKSLYYHYYEFPAVHMVKRHYGVRTERYKLIHFYNDIDVWELYDLQEDPKELNNLYGKEGYDQITKELMQELKRLQEQYDDPIRLAEAQK